MITASVMCLALNMYYEARSESYASRLAVAQVTLNRVASEKYPDTVCEVVWQRGPQFSWTLDGKSDVPKEKEAWATALGLSQLILEDPTRMSVECVGNSTHYHADYVVPEWSSKLDLKCKVGSHLFYSSESA